MKNLSFIGLMILLAACSTNSSKYFTNNGSVYGTYFSIKYESPDGKNLQKEIDSEFDRYVKIFSHYEKGATISKINRNEECTLEPEFIACFNRSIEIAEITGGAFDITAAPLINAWGFGPEDRQNMTAEKVDSIKAFTGYRRIRIENGKIVKETPEMELNMSAIAKGYTCDLIGQFLSKKGCANYMIDIGGEVVAWGKNEKGNTWTIGIREPEENPFSNNLNAAIRLPDHALATSGNYLNFYVDNGRKYAHTIDPASGYPVQHSLLSATVLAADCITADAFATAFMVLGKDASIEIANSLPDLEIYFIYSDTNGENKIYMSEGFEQYLVK